MGLRREISVQFMFGTIVIIQSLALALVGLGIISVNRPIAVSNTLLSTVLATISAYLLYSQVKIRERQVDIEEKMLAYETEPSLEIVNRKFRGDDAIISIANYGHGVAQELTLICTVTADSVDWYEGVESRTQLKRYDQDEDVVLEDSSLHPQENPELFIAESITVERIPTGEDESVSAGFESRMMELADENSGNIGISLIVEARSRVDEIGEVQEQAGDSLVVPLSHIPDTPNLQKVARYQQ